MFHSMNVYPFSNIRIYFAKISLYLEICILKNVAPFINFKRDFQTVS